MGDVAPADLRGDPAGDLSGAVAGAGFTEQGECVGGGGRTVALDSKINWAVGAECGFVQVDLDDLGVGTDQGAVPHRPHVQGAAETDDQVGAGDQFGGERGGESSGDAEVEVAVVEQPLGDRGGGQQRPGVLRQFGDLRAGLASAAAGDEDRALRGGEQLGEPLHRGGGRTNRPGR